MKRTPLRRKTRLKSGTKRLKVRRRSKRFAARRDPAYTAWIHTLPCWLRFTGSCFGATEATHVRSRGAGGDDRGNLVPLCHGHHMEQHRVGIQTWQATYRVNLPVVAAALTDRYLDESG